MVNEGLQAAEEKMRREGVPDAAIATFRYYHDPLEAPERGAPPAAELEPIEDIPEADALPDEVDAEALDRTVVVKLNGGLRTSMGMEKAKALLEGKEGHHVPDIIVRQILELRSEHDARLRLVLMDSFHTSEDTLAALREHPEIESDLPADFLQNKEPKVRVDDKRPVEWPDDPDLEWCPPGHGDIYTALLTSGTLEQMLDAGYEYAFISNSDNLGAVLEPRILAWFAREDVPFLMEVTRKTEADRKGGHPARLRESGQLVLRETAQTPDEDQESFRDIGKWTHVNTNNLWVTLRRLGETPRERDGVLGLPMIVNNKTVDPSDDSTPEVFQLETAMGAALGVIEGARVLSVPRTRFAPVKTTDDLLVLRSDAYVLTDDFRVVLAPERDDGAPLVSLDSKFYKRLRDFDARFPAGPPSLVAAERLAVEGDVRFGSDVTVRGDVEVRQDGGDQRVIDDGAVLEG